MSECYDLVFRGNILEGYSIESVQVNLKKALKLSDFQLQQLFSGSAVYLKKDISLEKAQVLQQKLAHIGAQSRVVPSVKRQSSVPQDLVEAEKPSHSGLTLSPIERPIESPVDEAQATSSSSIEHAATPYAEAALNKPRRGLSLDAIRRCCSGLLFVLVGALLLFTFPPFGEEAIRRGTAIGMLAFAFGAYRLMTWNR